MSECPRDRDEQVQSSGERDENGCDGGSELQEAHPPQSLRPAGVEARAVGSGRSSRRVTSATATIRTNHDAEDGCGRQSQGPICDRADEAGSEWNTEDLLDEEVVGVPRNGGVQEQCVDDSDNGA